MKIVVTPLAKSVLVPLGLMAAALVADAAIQKKIFGSGTTLVILNEEIVDIRKIDKFFEQSVLLIKVVSETIKNKAREQKGFLARFLSMLLGALAASLLVSVLADEEVIRG